jgi:hypothetical protein
MPNGHDANWTRTCLAIDGYRAKYGRWPKRVRMFPWAFANVVGHLLSPAGYALVSTFVELVPEEDACFIADDGNGAECCYGNEELPGPEPDPPAFSWFGRLIMREGPSGLEGIRLVE